MGQCISIPYPNNRAAVLLSPTVLVFAILETFILLSVSLLLCTSLRLIMSFISQIFNRQH